MPFLKMDLDAKKRVPLVARAAGVDEAQVGWGLMNLWEHVWLTKKAVVSETVIYGCFPGERTAEALVGFEFLEEAENGFRVKGAEAYLRVAEGRSTGGKKAAAAGNLKRGNTPPAGPQAGVSAGNEPQVTPSLPPAEPQLPPSSYTQHPAPRSPDPIKAASSSSTKSDAHTPLAVVPPDTPAETWVADDFWRWAQSRRMAAGLVVERGPPRDIGQWWSAARMTPGVTCRRLKSAFEAFGQDAYWERQRPPFPFRGFMSQWANFVGEEHAATG